MKNKLGIVIPKLYNCVLIYQLKPEISKIYKLAETITKLAPQICVKTFVFLLNGMSNIGIESRTKPSLRSQGRPVIHHRTKLTKSR